MYLSNEDRAEPSGDSQPMCNTIHGRSVEFLWKIRLPIVKNERVSLNKDNPWFDIR
jgi:hypothetical protein